MSPDRGSSALKAMQRVCSMREYCESDILSKLERFELNPGEAEKILESLKADKFVEDNRYSQAFVRDKSRLSGWGSRKISFALRRKKIEQNIINEAIKELDKTSEAERLLKILTVKAKTIGKEESRAKKNRKTNKICALKRF